MLQRQPTYDRSLENDMTRDIYHGQEYAPKTTSAIGHSVLIGDVEMYFEEYGAGLPFDTNSGVSIIPGGYHIPIYHSIVPFTSTALRFPEESEGNHLPAESRTTTRQ